MPVSITLFVNTKKNHLVNTENDFYRSKIVNNTEVLK